MTVIEPIPDYDAIWCAAPDDYDDGGGYDCGCPDLCDSDFVPDDPDGIYD